MNPALQRAALDQRIGRRHRLRSVLLYLAAREPDEDGWIDVKHSTIARALAIDRADVCRDLQELRALGYLDVEADAHGRCGRYRFREAVMCGEIPQVRTA